MQHEESKCVASLLPCLRACSSHPLRSHSIPVRPIRIVVAFAPGGASDVLARQLAERLTEAFGQTVVVDNRPSAGGIIGTDLVAKAIPDGYTLLIGSAAAFAITPHLQTKLPYDTTKDFVPVAPFTSLIFVLNVHPDVKATSVKELIALAKSRPAMLNIGSAGNGTTTHIVGEMFKYAAGIDMVHVPYKGAAPAMVDLIGGRIHVLFDAAVTTHSAALSKAPMRVAYISSSGSD